MKDVKILGTGCATCNQLLNEVKAVVAADGLDVSIEKVEDIQQIIAWGVMTTPALVVDGRVVCKGRVPSRSEIKELLTAESHGCCCGGGGHDSHQKRGGGCCS